jgi:hypothetical protein
MIGNEGVSARICSNVGTFAANNETPKFLSRFPSIKFKHLSDEELPNIAQKQSESFGITATMLFKL